MSSENLTVTGLLLTYATGATALVAFLWRHYEARLKELREELKTEQRENDRNVALFTKALERAQLTPSSKSEPPSLTGTRSQR